MAADGSISKADADKLLEKLTLDNTKGGYVPSYPMSASAPTSPDPDAPSNPLPRIVGFAQANSIGRTAAQYLGGALGGGAYDLASGAPAPGADAVGSVSSLGPIAPAAGIHDAGEVDGAPRQMLELSRDPAPKQPAISSNAGYSDGLRKAWDNASSKQLQGITDAGDLQRQLGVDQAGRTMAEGDLREQNAARMQRDAEDQQRIDAKAAADHQAFLDRQMELADEIGRLKPDPGRLLRNADHQTQFTIGLGAALGGGLAAMNGGGTNTSLDRLDKIIDKDIAAQNSEIANKKDSLTARSSLFGQMLQETGDRRLAAMQTKKLMYDAMDLKFKADADRLGIPELRTNAEIHGQELDRKRNDLTAEMAKQSLANARAAAAAQVQAQRAAEERQWQHQVEITKLKQEQQKIDIEAGKGNPADKERQKAQMELDANLGVLTGAEKDIGKITAGGDLGNMASVLPAWAPGVTGARLDVQRRDAFNTQARMMVAAAYKLSTNANEPKSLKLLEEYAKPYVIVPSDNQEIASAKIAGLRKLMLDGGRSQGASGPTPSTVGPRVP